MTADGQQRAYATDIMFVLPHLGPGGAQKVAVGVANEWVKAGKRVCFLTTLDNKPEVHRLHLDVERVRLGLSVRKPKLGPGKFRGLRSTRFLRVLLVPFTWILPTQLRVWLDRKRLSARTLLNRIMVLGAGAVAGTIVGSLTLKSSVATLNKAIEQADPGIVVSFLTKTNVLCSLACDSKKRRLVISERNDPDLQKLTAFWSNLRKRSYQRAEMVTANSRAIAKKLELIVHRPVEFLPNPIFKPLPIAIPISDRPNVILSAGRLVHQKGFDVFLEGISLMVEGLENWRVEMLGDGPLYEELSQRVQRHGLTSFVTLHGHVDPEGFFKSARILVIPSRFEGMPNVALEAMANGVVILVSDACEGAIELIEPSATVPGGGIFQSENPRHLAEMLTCLTQDEERLNAISHRNRSVAKRFLWENARVVWDQILLGQ